MTGDCMVFTEYNDHGHLIPVECRCPAGYGIPGLIIQTRAPYTTDDAAHDPHVIPEIHQILRFRTLANVPIISPAGTLLGCFQIHDKAGGPFTQNDVDMLTDLAATAAVALENAQILLDRTKTAEALHENVDDLSESRNMLRLVMDTIPVRVFWKDTTCTI